MVHLCNRYVQPCRWWSHHGRKNEKYLHYQEFFLFFLVSLGLSGGYAMMDNVYMYNHKLSYKVKTQLKCD